MATWSPKRRPSGSRSQKTNLCLKSSSLRRPSQPTQQRARMLSRRGKVALPASSRRLEVSRRVENIYTLRRIISVPLSRVVQYTTVRCESTRQLSPYSYYTIYQLHTIPSRPASYCYLRCTRRHPNVEHSNTRTANSCKRRGSGRRLASPQMPNHLVQCRTQILTF
jgi:hypothetical protein